MSVASPPQLRAAKSPLPPLTRSRIVPPRPSRFTNFVEFRKYTLVYRRYKGVYFTLCCDPTDNEMAMLEAIHLFVMILDQYFGQVCELDLVYDFYKVFALLDEFFLGGEIQETSSKVILNRMMVLEEYERKSIK